MRIDVIWAKEQRRLYSEWTQPGAQWRILAHNEDEGINVDMSSAEFPSVFDELVIDGWLHLEQMEDQAWWLRLGESTFWIQIEDGKAKVSLTERGLDLETEEV